MNQAAYIAQFVARILVEADAEWDLDADEARAAFLAAVAAIDQGGSGTDEEALAFIAWFIQQQLHPDTCRAGST